MIDDINAAPDYGDEPPIACSSFVDVLGARFPCGATPGHTGRHYFRATGRGTLPKIDIEWDDQDAATQDDDECPDCGLHKPLRAVHDEAEQESARYALVEQMGHRATYAAIRETTFLGEPMLEVTALNDGSVHLVSPKSIFEVTLMPEDQARNLGARATSWTAVAAIGSGRDPFGAWADDDDIDPDEGKDDGMSASEREAYDRDAEFALDAADEARDLEREAEADA